MNCLSVLTSIFQWILTLLSKELLTRHGNILNFLRPEPVINSSSPYLLKRFLILEVINTSEESSIMFD